jgi:hypothetical protein
VAARHLKGHIAGDGLTRCQVPRTEAAIADGRVEELRRVFHQVITLELEVELVVALLAAARIVYAEMDHGEDIVAFWREE